MSGSSTSSSPLPAVTSRRAPAAFLTSVRGLSVLLVVACCLLYGGFLHNPPVFDDGYFFNGVTLQAYWHEVSPWQLRWLPYATFSWTQMLLGMDLAWYHLGNLLLHAANAVLLMRLLRRVFLLAFDGPSTDKAGQLSLTLCAFFGALVFALHPAAVYAVAYLNQRSTLMAMCFALLSLHAVMAAMEKEKAGYFWLAVLWYLAAVFAKEHVIMLPAVALALLWLKRPSRRLVRAAVLPGLMSIAIAGGVTWLIKSHGVIATAYQSDGPALVARNLGAGGHPWPLSIITQCTLFFKYWLLWLLPNPAWMSVDMYEPFARRLLAWPQFAGCLAFLIYGAVAAWLLWRRGKRGLLGLALLAPWLMFATELSTVRIQEPFVLYRSYLWMALPIGCLPLLLLSVGRKRAMIYLGAACLALVPLSINRLQSFSHPLLLWDDAVSLAEHQAVEPGMERLYYNRGTELARLKLYPQAIADYTRALQLYPQYSYAYLNRGIAFHHLGQDRRALADFDASVALNSANPLAWWNRGLSLRAVGRADAARSDFAQACRHGLAIACKK